MTHVGLCVAMAAYPRPLAAGLRKVLTLLLPVVCFTCGWRTPCPSFSQIIHQMVGINAVQTRIRSLVSAAEGRHHTQHGLQQHLSVDGACHRKRPRGNAWSGSRTVCPFWKHDTKKAAFCVDPGVPVLWMAVTPPAGQLLQGLSVAAT